MSDDREVRVGFRLDRSSEPAMHGSLVGATIVDCRTEMLDVPGGEPVPMLYLTIMPERDDA